MLDIKTIYSTRHKTYEEAVVRSERGELAEKFRARLNETRKGAGFAQITPARMMMLVQGIPNDDLYAFYRQCEQAKNFSAFFWWSVKPKTHSSTEPTGRGAYRK